jgi:membrane-bound ClpP family serine protease
MPLADPFAHLAGATGRAISPLGPAGTVLVNHEQWSAVTAGEAIGDGEPIEVIARDGLKLRVRRASGDGRAAPS